MIRPFIDRLKVGITLLVFILCSLSTSQAKAETLTFSTHTTPPVSSFLKDVLRHALMRNSWDLDFKEMPGRRVIYLVNNGQINGDASRVINFQEISNDATENYRIVNEGIYKVSLHLITHKDTHDIKADWDDINQGKVTYIRGSKYIRKNVVPANRRPTDSIENILRQIYNKRIESAVVFKSVIQNAQKNYPIFFNDLKIEAKPLASFWLYPYLHKDSEKYGYPIARALRDMKIEGIFDQLLIKHGLGDLDHKTDR